MIKYTEEQNEAARRLSIGDRIVLAIKLSRPYPNPDENGDLIVPWSFEFLEEREIKLLKALFPEVK